MTLPRRALLVAAAAAGIPAATGCVGRPQPATSPQPIDPPRDATYAYTHQRPGGNRVVSGGGAVVDATPVEFAVAGTPAWLLASGRERATDWTVVTDRGAATTHRIEAGSGTAERVADHGTVPLPPLGYRAGGTPRVVVPPPDAAAHTHPVVAGDAVAYVAADGDVVIRQNETTTRADVAAPPDARPVALGDGRYVVYGGWTDRYRHGALGDTVEGSSLVVVDPPAGRITVAATLDPPAVFEGLYPLVADLDGSRPEVATAVTTALGSGSTRRTDANEPPVRRTGPGGATSSVRRRSAPTTRPNSPSSGSHTSTEPWSTTGSTPATSRSGPPARGTRPTPTARGTSTEGSGVTSTATGAPNCWCRRPTGRRSRWSGASPTERSPSALSRWVRG